MTEKLIIMTDNLKADIMTDKTINNFIVAKCMVSLENTELYSVTEYQNPHQLQ